MLIRTFKIGRSLAVLAALLVVAGCAKNISKTDARTWFEEHKVALIELQARLINERTIRRIDPGMDIKFVPKFANFDGHALEVYRALESQCLSLGIKNVSVSREGSTGEGEVFSVRYILSSLGIAPSSGGFVGIEYTTDADYIKKLRRNGQTVEALDVDGWYVVRS